MSRVLGAGDDFQIQLDRHVRLRDAQLARAGSATVRAGGDFARLAVDLNLSSDTRCAGGATGSSRTKAVRNWA